MLRSISAVLVFLAGAALAQSGGDVAVVSGIRGVPTYESEGAGSGRVRPFMRVRHGDRFSVPAGGSLRVVFFQGGRQETWTGPASFRAGAGQGLAVSGTTPDVAILPLVTPQKIARVPELVQGVLLGGVTVRGGTAVVPPPLDAQQLAEVSEARQTYRTLRAQAAADDIMPELYLMAVLQEFSLYQDMKALIPELVRRQPDSEEVKGLAKWLEARLQRAP